MGTLVLHYTILSAQKPSWKSGNKKWGANTANQHLAELLYSVQLKEPSFFLPLLGGGHQAATWRHANSTHHWLPFQQMRNLPKYRTEWGENGSKSRADQEKSAFTFCIAKVLGSERWKGPPDLPGKGAGSMALWKCIIGEKSRLQAAAGNSASGDLWAVVSRNPVRSLLNCRAVLGEAYSLPLPQHGHAGQVLGRSDVSPWFIYLMKNNERDDPQESLEIPLTLQIEHTDKLVIILKRTRESERKNACRKGLFNAQRF